MKALEILLESDIISIVWTTLQTEADILDG